NGWVQSRTGSDGQTTTYTYWADGQVKTVTDPLTNTTSYSYDQAGRRTNMMDALSHTIQYQYDAVGRQVGTVFQDQSAVTNIYNDLGQRTGTIDQANLLTQFAYDVSGQLINVTKPIVVNPANNQTNAPQWAYGFDQYERQIATIDPLGHSNTVTYDALGRQLTTRLPMGGMATNVYATNSNAKHLKGQLWRQYDYKGQYAEFQYDQFGRLAGKFYFAVGDSVPSKSVTYGYDWLGQMTNLTERYGSDATNGYAYLHSVNYGPAHQMLGYVKSNPNAASGSLLLALGGMVLLALPRVKQRALFGKLQYAWQEQLELFAPLWTAIRYGRGDRRRLRLPSLIWRFATLITLASLIANEPGMDRLWQAHADTFSYPSNASTTTTRYTSFAYDNDGHLTQVNCPEGVINYAYELATGRLLETNTKNSDVQYSYDALGRLHTVSVMMRNATVLSTPEVTTYGYDQVGNRNSVMLPNGITSLYSYDSLNRLTNLVHKTSSVTNASYAYKLDITGRRTNAVEVLALEAGTYQTNTLNWAYDGLYRLTNEVCVTKAAGFASGYTNAYVYDLVGNRLTQVKTTSVITTTTNLYDANDQLLREVTK
ncbi:MAG TPA: hypothetical protein VF607_08115, partial [Verrucomicrobiae bacterium]